MKKKLAATLSVVLILGLAVLGILAYLTDTDSDVNVMTLGNVSIDQFEKERVFDDEGNVISMKDFTQGQALFPAVVTNGPDNQAWAPNTGVDIYYKDYLGDEYPGGNGTWQNLNNVMDKFVFVKNTGKSDAYYRTVFLFEADKTGFKNAQDQGLIHLNVNGHNNFTWGPDDGDVNEETLTVDVNGMTYNVVVATYNAKLAPNEISRPSLLQVGMDQQATNELVAQFGDTYDILVLSQAVQTEGFSDAATALNTAFGEINAENVVKWFGDVEKPTVVDNVKDLDSVLLEGGNVVLSEDLAFSSSETNANSGYGATGISVKGGTLDGAGHSLGINNWGTWDAAVHTTGGTIKNLTINSGMRGIFMGSATADVYIDNVIIDGTIYTFNSDGGNKKYGVYISNSTLNGWTSHSDVHKEVVYTDCNFGECNGYAFCRPYGPTVFKNCDFKAGFEVDSRGAVTFENCTIDGEPLTADNLSTLVISNIANATVK